MIQSQKTINQAVAEWLKLSPEEVKDFEDKFENSCINLFYYFNYKMSFSDDIRNATHDTLYSIYKQNTLARPLLLKYILDKERDVIEEVVTESFLESLVQKIEENYESDTELKKQELTKLESDKKNFLKLESEKLILDYKQNLAQIQTKIDNVNRDITVIKNHQSQLEGYSTYTDKIKAREKILLHIKKHNPDVLHDMFSKKVEEYFIRYLEQLDPQKITKAYSKIHMGDIYGGKYNWRGAVLNTSAAILLSSMIGVFVGIFLGLIVFIFTCRFMVHVNWNTFLLTMIGTPLTVSAILCIIMPLTTMISRRDWEKRFLLENKDLHLSSTKKVNTSENQELHSTSKSQEIDRDQNNLSNENKSVITDPSMEADQELQSNDANLNITQDKQNLYPNLKDMKEPSMSNQNAEFQNNLKDASIIPSAPLAETEVTDIVTLNL